MLTILEFEEHAHLQEVLVGFDCHEPEVLTRPMLNQEQKSLLHHELDFDTELLEQLHADVERVGVEERFILDLHVGYHVGEGSFQQLDHKLHRHITATVHAEQQLRDLVEQFNHNPYR